MNFANLAARAIQRTLQQQPKGRNFVGQLHPSYKLWLRDNFDIKREVLQTPLTASAGIFDEVASLTMWSVPEEDQGSWDAEFENTEQLTPWASNCLTAVRSDGGGSVAQSIVYNAIRSVAEHGIRCVIVIEKSNSMEDIDFDIPLALRSQVIRTTVAIFHTGTTLWADSFGWEGAWVIDAKGIPQGSEEDGSFEVRRTVDGVPVGGNKNPLEIIIYAPNTGPKTCPNIPKNAARKLTLIAANVSLPRLDGKLLPPIKLRLGTREWTQISLSNLPLGKDLDGYAAVRVMGWQPQQHIPIVPTIPGLMRMGGDNLEELRAIREGAKGLITDGVVPTALVHEFALRHTPSWEVDRRPFYANAEAEASTARIVARHMSDVVRLFSELRMAKMTALLVKAGTNAGSLSLAHVGARGTARCMVCEEKPTRRWIVEFAENVETKALFDKALHQVWRKEAATWGPDLEPPKKHSKQKAITENEYTREYQTKAENRRERRRSRELGPLESVHDDMTSEQRRLRGAREAAKVILKREGVRVCLNCAATTCRPDARERVRVGEVTVSSSQAQTFRTLVDFATKGKVGSKALPPFRTVRNTDDPDIFGRNKKITRLLEQVVIVEADWGLTESLNGDRFQLGQVVTIAPTEVDGDLLAYVRPQGAAKGGGVEGCIVMDLKQVEVARNKWYAELERRKKPYGALLTKSIREQRPLRNPDTGNERQVASKPMTGVIGQRRSRVIEDRCAQPNAGGKRKVSLTPVHRGMNPPQESGEATGNGCRVPNSCRFHLGQVEEIDNMCILNADILDALREAGKDVSRRKRIVQRSAEAFCGAKNTLLLATGGNHFSFVFLRRHAQEGWENTLMEHWDCLGRTRLGSSLHDTRALAREVCDLVKDMIGIRHVTIRTVEIPCAQQSRSATDCAIHTANALVNTLRGVRPGRLLSDVDPQILDLWAKGARLKIVEFLHEESNVFQQSHSGDTVNGKMYMERCMKPGGPKMMIEVEEIPGLAYTGTFINVRTLQYLIFQLVTEKGEGPLSTILSYDEPWLEGVVALNVIGDTDKDGTEHGLGKIGNIVVGDFYILRELEGVIGEGHTLFDDATKGGDDEDDDNADNDDNGTAGMMGKQAERGDYENGVEAAAIDYCGCGVAQIKDGTVIASLRFGIETNEDAREGGNGLIESTWVRGPIVEVSGVGKILDDDASEDGDDVDVGVRRGARALEMSMKKDILDERYQLVSNHDGDEGGLIIGGRLQHKRVRDHGLDESGYAEMGNLSEIADDQRATFKRADGKEGFVKTLGEDGTSSSKDNGDVMATGMATNDGGSDLISIVQVEAAPDGALLQAEDDQGRRQLDLDLNGAGLVLDKDEKDSGGGGGDDVLDELKIAKSLRGGKQTKLTGHQRKIYCWERKGAIGTRCLKRKLDESDVLHGAVTDNLVDDEGERIAKIPVLREALDEIGVEGRTVEITTGNLEGVLVGNSGNNEDGMVNWVIRDESNGNSNNVETGLRLFDLDLNGVTEDLDSVVMNGVDKDGSGLIVAGVGDKALNQRSVLVERKLMNGDRAPDGGQMDGGGTTDTGQTVGSGIVNTEIETRGALGHRQSIPKPANWKFMTKTQRTNWYKRKSDWMNSQLG
jgi:hypothetical protein